MNGRIPLDRLSEAFGVDFSDTTIADAKALKIDGILAIRCHTFANVQSGVDV